MKEEARPAKSQPIFSLSSMCAAQLLLEFVSDSHPRLLRCWVAHAGDLDKLAASALAATSRLLGYLLPQTALAVFIIGEKTALDLIVHCQYLVFICNRCRQVLQFVLSAITFASAYNRALLLRDTWYPGSCISAQL